MIRKSSRGYNIKINQLTLTWSTHTIHNQRLIKPLSRSIFRILKFKHRKINTRKFLSRILTNRVPLSYVELDRSNEGRHHQADISLQYLDAKSLLQLARGATASEPERQMQYREFGTAAGTTANSSQCGSSLDLEWENDYEGCAGAAAAAGGAPSSAHQMMWINLPKSQRHHQSSFNDKSPLSLCSSSSESSEKKDNSIECSAKIHERKANSWSHISTPDSNSMEWDVVTEDNRLKSEDCDSVDQDTRDLLFEIEQLKNRALQETGHFSYDLNKYMDETET